VDAGTLPPFLVGSNGEVTVSGYVALDHESQDVFYLLIRAFDGQVYSAVKNVTVHLTDLNENPVFQVVNFFIDENFPVGAAVATLFASDVDQPSQVWVICVHFIACRCSPLFIF
jgi:hypothetical protein